MDLELAKKSTHTISPDWLELSILLGKTSDKIIKEEKVDEELGNLIYVVLSIAKFYNINLHHAWSRWKKKAINKVYK